MSSHPDVPPSDPGPTPAETVRWTFVLEGPCAGCGFAGGHVPAAEASERLRRAAVGWEAALARPDAHTRPRPDVWSPVEYAAHVRDLCRLLPARLAAVVAFDEPELADWDQDAEAVARQYWRAEQAEVARDLSAWTRVATAAVDAVPADAWARRGRRTDGVTLSAADLATLVVHETEHHLVDVGGSAADRRADEEAIAGAVRTFFSAFESGPGAAAALDRLRGVLLPQAVVVRTCGQEPLPYDVEGFIAPRAALLAGGGLTGFREWTTGGHTEIFGDVAQHWCAYAKEWTQDGRQHTGRGMKTVQLVRTTEGWRISAAAWDDERDGVTMPAFLPVSAAPADTR